MGRAPLAGVLLVVSVGVADAGNTRKVDIDSDPQGAQVYIGDIDTGTACTATPCTIEAPLGNAVVIIVRKDGYNPEFKSIDVPRRGKIRTLKVTLSSSIATLVFEDPALKGGTIKVDDVEKGTAPARLDVEATSHHVVVVLKGKEIAEEFVNLEQGDEQPIKAKIVAAQTTVAEPTNGEGDGNATTTKDPDTTKVVTTTPGPARAPFITVGGVFEVGFREFYYDNPQNGLPTQEIEPGQIMLGGALELWPMELLGASHLRGLSLYGKAAFGVNSLKVVDDMNMPLGPSTFWQDIEIDARHRWRIGEGGAIEIGAGFVIDDMEYNAMNKSLTDQLPVVDYKSVRLGVRLGARAGGKVDVYGGLEGRIVLSGGTLASRFDKADITGGKAIAGLSTRLGPVFLKLEGSLLYYGWTFTTNTVMAGKPTADGAKDIVEVVSVLVGLTH